MSNQMEMKNKTATPKEWVFFTFLSAFSIYWSSNLLLWFPWSYNAVLGITLMLTVSPLIWALGVFQCLKKYPGEQLIKGAILTSFICILISVIADYVFFGIIRNAIKDLYRPTTFYGYLFLIILPFILLFMFPKQLKNRQTIKRSDYIKYIALAAFSMLVILIIIEFNITV